MRRPGSAAAQPAAAPRSSQRRVEGKRACRLCQQPSGPARSSGSVLGLRALLLPLLAAEPAPAFPTRLRPPMQACLWATRSTIGASSTSASWTSGQRRTWRRRAARRAKVPHATSASAHACPPAAPPRRALKPPGSWRTSQAPCAAPCTPRARSMHHQIASVPQNAGGHACGSACMLLVLPAPLPWQHVQTITLPRSYPPAPASRPCCFPYSICKAPGASSAPPARRRMQLPPRRRRRGGRPLGPGPAGAAAGGGALYDAHTDGAGKPLARSSANGATGLAPAGLLVFVGAEGARRLEAAPAAACPSAHCFAHHRSLCMRRLAAPGPRANPACCCLPDHARNRLLALLPLCCAGPAAAAPSGARLHPLLCGPPPDPQVLLAERQHREARELLQAALDVCGKR